MSVDCHPGNDPCFSRTIRPGHKGVEHTAFLSIFHSFILCSCILTLALTFGSTQLLAQTARYDDGLSGKIHYDPLRPYLPRADLFMPVPGGVVAAEDESLVGLSVEERAANLHGGLVVGYCLKSSCSRVTHIAILQICNNRLGGLDGSDTLVLGVMKLPVGTSPGYLLALQGRNYAENFADFGPYSLDLVEDVSLDGSAVQNIVAEGKGPVAPLGYDGRGLDEEQGPETRTLEYSVLRFEGKKLLIPHIEVRHLCKQPIG